MLLGILIGMFFGTVLGYIIAALMCASSRADECEQCKRIDQAVKRLS